MMHRLVILVCVATFVAAFPETTPWPGPYADHINGQPVRDTPAVEAAKKHHFTHYSKVLAVLPKLPPEEQIGEKHHGHDVHLHNQAQQQRNYQYIPPNVPAPVHYVPPTPVPYHHQDHHQHVHQHIHEPVHQQAYHPIQHDLQPDSHYNHPHTFTHFAEEVPLSEFGETPEVAAAREAHLSAFKKAEELQGGKRLRF